MISGQIRPAQSAAGHDRLAFQPLPNPELIERRDIHLDQAERAPRS